MIYEVVVTKVVTYEQLVTVYEATNEDDALDIAMDEKYACDYDWTEASIEFEAEIITD